MIIIYYGRKILVISRDVRNIGQMIRDSFSIFAVLFPEESSLFLEFVSEWLLAGSTFPECGSSG